MFKRLFRQRGRTLAARIDSQGDEWLPALGRAVVLDLGCGTGTLGSLLRAQCDRSHYPHATALAVERHDAILADLEDISEL